RDYCGLYDTRYYNMDDAIFLPYQMLWNMDTHSSILQMPPERVESAIQELRKWPVKSGKRRFIRNCSAKRDDITIREMPKDRIKDYRWFWDSKLLPTLQDLLM